MYIWNYYIKSTIIPNLQQISKNLYRLMYHFEHIKFIFAESRPNLPLTLRVKGYTRFVGKYATGGRKRCRPHKVYIFLIRITSRVDLAMTVCRHERCDLGNYKSCHTVIRHADSRYSCAAQVYFVSVPRPL